MSILKDIKSAQLSARKEKNRFKAGILTALISEVSIIGKNQGIDETKDEDSLKVITKFKKGINDTILLLKDKITYPEKMKELKDELEIYESFLPKQLSEDELKENIEKIIKNGSTNIGQIMGSLKKSYGGTYDGKIASNIIKSLI